MKFFRIFLLAGLLGGAVGSVCGQAVVEGRVKLPPPRSAEVVNKRYNMNVDTTLIEPDPPAAVVYLEGKFPAPAVLPKMQMAQKKLQFVMPLLPVRVGTTVEFPNLDDTYHNIFSYSKPKRFDLGRYRGDEKPVPAQTFDKPGVVVLHCDIHEYMRAIILVLETPHFQKTDEAGRYRLENLPAGHYTLKAWLNNKNIQERAVELKAGTTLHVDFP